MSARQRAAEALAASEGLEVWGDCGHQYQQSCLERADAVLAALGLEQVGYCRQLPDSVWEFDDLLVPLPTDTEAGWTAVYVMRPDDPSVT